MKLVFKINFFSMSVIPLLEIIKKEKDFSNRSYHVPYSKIEDDLSSVTFLQKNSKQRSQPALMQLNECEKRI